MGTVCLKGTIISGKGEGARFVNLSWARRQIKEKLGFTPHLGTLNIVLTRRSIKLKQTLTKATGVEIQPPSGYCRGKLFAASVMKVTCGVVVPDVPGYPEDLVEVVSSTNLRERFHFVDGDRVEVEVMF